MIVYIEWEDAWTHRGWVQKDDIADGLTLIKTIGFLVSEDDDMVRVAMMRDVGAGDDVYNYATSIPRVNIKKYLELNVKGGHIT